MISPSNSTLPSAATVALTDSSRENCQNRSWSYAYGFWPDPWPASLHLLKGFFFLLVEVCQARSYFREVADADCQDHLFRVNPKELALRIDPLFGEQLMKQLLDS